LSPPPTALSDLSTATQPLATLLQQTAAAAGIMIGAVPGLPAIDDAMQRLSRRPAAPVATPSVAW
jgi:hypothetical protein